MAYLRFLTDNDYISIATKEHMRQLIRGEEERVPQAEQRAEMNMLEHLDQYYEIEKLLAQGKSIREYSPLITYPGRTHIKIDGEIFKTLKGINGLKKPTLKVYWKHVADFVDPCLVENARKYTQLGTYAKGDVVIFGTEYWICMIPHGYDTGEVHVPGASAWKQAEVVAWEPNMEWEKDQVCSYGELFYQYLVTEESNENSQNQEDNGEGGGEEAGAGKGGEEAQEPSYETDLSPDLNERWGLIGDYSQDYEYDWSDGARDYVVAEGAVFYPVMNPNPDKPQVGENITRDDPRNPNIVTHMSRIALYYLHQIISPTNISETRRWAYEDSMMWLHDAAKFKINPQLPRKKEQGTGNPKVDWALSTFQKSYDPNENAWLI